MLKIQGRLKLIPIQALWAVGIERTTVSGPEVRNLAVMKRAVPIMIDLTKISNKKKSTKLIKKRRERKKKKMKN